MDIRSTYFYPLYKKFEQEFFLKLRKAVEEKYHFVGKDEDKEYFIKTLLCFQVAKDYRTPLKSVKKHLASESDIAEINKLVKKQSFKIDTTWVIWKSDFELVVLAKKIYKTKLRINGTSDEFDEFVLRYLISAWLVAWQGPLFMILKNIMENRGKANLKSLNDMMKKWDFTDIF
jgi:hypothetical protein